MDKINHTVYFTNVSCTKAYYNEPFFNGKTSLKKTNECFLKGTFMVELTKKGKKDFKTFERLFIANNIYMQQV